MSFVSPQSAIEEPHRRLGMRYPVMRRRHSEGLKCAAHFRHSERNKLVYRFPRNRNIAEQARFGKRDWRTESGYSKRSKVETTFYRYKVLVGSAMRARGLAAQRVEARLGCKILNTMTALGMPGGEMIE